MIDFIPGIRQPKLKFFESCVETINTMPLLKHAMSSQLQKEDLDTTQKYDDIADALRYALFSATEYEIDVNYEFDKELLYAMETVQTVNNPIGEDSIFKAKEVAPFLKQAVLNPYDAMMLYAYAHDTPIKNVSRGNERNTLHDRYTRLRR